MVYLSVTNFEKYQHYKERRPPWIKLYVSFLCSPNVYPLSDVCKYHLVAIMSLASQHDNRIPFNKAWIAHAIHANSRINWDALLSCGMLECTQDASNALASCKQESIVETETETDIQRQREKRASKRAVTPPENFPITPALKEWASKHAKGVNLENETEKFLDHHRSKGDKFVDWDASWRKWMRNAAEWGSARNGSREQKKVEQYVPFDPNKRM